MRRALIGVIVAAALWAGGTVAFACTYVPHLYSTSPESGAPGTDVTVSGQAIGAKGPVAIRWNGLKGPVLGAVTPDPAGNFSVVVKVPDVSPNVYFLVAVAEGSGVARQAFEVTGSRSAAAAVPLVPATAPNPVATPVGVPASDSSQGLSMVGAGLVLLAGGLVIIGAGSTVAIAQRRRVVVRDR